MAITVQLVVDNTAPDHGDTLTATYVVSGNTGVPPQAGTLSGSATVGGETFEVSTVVTRPAVPPLPEEFDAPVMEGLTFEATAEPNVFTALVP